MTGYDQATTDGVDAGHGTAGVHPFPGYLHGANPGICPNGCTPDTHLTRNGHLDETPLQSVIREAMEFQTLFHKEKQSAPLAAERRKEEILASIEATGTYRHTEEELAHGARVAWR